MSRSKPDQTTVGRVSALWPPLRAFPSSGGPRGRLVGPLAGRSPPAGVTGGRPGSPARRKLIAALLCATEGSGGEQRAAGGGEPAEGRTGGGRSRSSSEGRS